MEYVRDTEPKGPPIFHLDTRKDRKDAAYVRFSCNMMELRIILVVTIS